MNAVPTLTTEQRRDALAQAAEARRARAELRRDMKAGRIEPTAALDDPRAQRLHVRQFLSAIPGIGERRADKMMLRLRIAQNRRVRGLGHRQRDGLIASLTEKGR